jgi:hypothetical protein
LRDDSRAAWELARLAKGQIRVAPMGGVLGFDLNAVFAMADALGFERAEVAVFFPFIEAGLVAACNRRDE